MAKERHRVPSVEIEITVPFGVPYVDAFTTGKAKRILRVGGDKGWLKVAHAFSLLFTLNGPRRRLHKSGALVETAHEIHVLYRLPGHPLHEIVYRRHDDNPLPAHGDRNIAEVRRKHVLQVWRVLTDSNERFVSVVGTK